MKLLIKSGQQAVAAAGTAEALTATAIDARKLRLKAPTSNTGNVFIGDSTVDSATGFIMEPGDGVNVSDLLGSDYGSRYAESVSFDLSKVYVDAANNGDLVSFTYLTEDS